MKKLIIFALFAISITYNALADDNRQTFKINKKSAISIACSTVDTLNTNIFVSKDILPPLTCISSPKAIHSPQGYSWLVFIDLNPSANWGHEALCIFVDANTGQCSQVECNMPPTIEMEQIRDDFLYKVRNKEIIYEEVLGKKSNIKRINTEETIWDYSDNNHALIINGGLNLIYNHERYWNNCSQIYQNLINVYKYKKIISKY